MLTQQHNIFHVLANELGKSVQPALDLTAAERFEVAGLHIDMDIVLAAGDEALVGMRAAEALAIHYNLCAGGKFSHPAFCDGCEGVIRTQTALIKFAVRQTGVDPASYDVCFSRLPAMAWTPHPGPDHENHESRGEAGPSAARRASP